MEATSAEARAPQRDVPWGVRLLVAHQASGRWAPDVGAARAGGGWAASDAVKVLGRLAPVARPQLVRVDRGLAAVAAVRSR